MSRIDRRSRLRSLARRASGGLVSVTDAVAAWGGSPHTAAVRLAGLARSGWLARVQRGLYYLPALDAGPSIAAEDPWVLANALFGPCYIGGRTAAEHWELTEQIFRSTFVVTAANIRRRTRTSLGSEFRLVKVARARIEGVGSVWRGTARVRVSSAERTLVDGLRDPSWLGGMRHLTDTLKAYRDSGRGSAHKLEAELAKHANGAAWKRAGFLAERLWPEAEGIVEAALARRSSGVIKLDPAVRSRGKMSRRWGLWLNVSVTQGER
jgi:predicted transcriptional regulator of viral defense system